MKFKCKCGCTDYQRIAVKCVDLGHNSTKIPDELKDSEYNGFLLIDVCCDCGNIVRLIEEDIDKEEDKINKLIDNIENLFTF